MYYYYYCCYYYYNNITTYKVVYETENKGIRQEGEADEDLTWKVVCPQRILCLWISRQWDSRTEMRMLHWILGITLQDKKRNDNIHHAIGIVCITDKIHEARLRLYGHIQWWDDDHCKVHGCRSQGRQRKRLTNIECYTSITEDWDEWRRRNLADPSPEGFTAWRRERERESIITVNN